MNNKTVLIGDIHGKGIFQYIIHKEKPDRVIILGDYWDSFDIGFEAQMYNYKRILDLKRDSNIEVILLIGNHDVHYHPYFIQTGEHYSGFQGARAGFITEIIEANKNLFQMAYKMGDILFTHAGVGEQWLRDNKYEEEQDIVEFINDLWVFTPKVFGFRGNDPYGDSPEASPVWIRPKSLIRGNPYLKKKFIQIVGHTRRKAIDNSAGSRFLFVDTLDDSGEYLIIEDGEITVGKV